MGGNLHTPVRDQPSHRASPRNTTDASTGGPSIAVGTAPCRPHLSAHPSTVAANRKRSPSTRSSPGIRKPFSSTSERPSTDCRSTSRKRCGPTSIAAFWPTSSCAPVVRTAGRAGGGGRRYERSVLRPSPGVGGPAGPGLSLRPQRMRDLWRAPADRRRPDRSGLDPDLSGGGRAAGDAPAEGPAAAAVRVRRLTSSAIRSLRREPYGGVCPQVPD